MIMEEMPAGRPPLSQCTYLCPRPTFPEGCAWPDCHDVATNDCIDRHAWEIPPEVPIPDIVIEEPTPLEIPPIIPDPGTPPIEP